MTTKLRKLSATFQQYPWYVWLAVGIVCADLRQDPSSFVAPPHSWLDWTLASLPIVILIGFWLYLKHSLRRET